MTHIEAQFSSLNIWRRGSERAPHKPLLVLLALGRIQRNDGRLFKFADIESQLISLLDEFGPSRSSHRPEYPFWRLQTDGIWEIVSDYDLTPNRSGDVKRTLLLKSHAKGGFTKDVFERLKKDQQLTKQIALSILDTHFPSTIHADILQAVGLDLETVQVTRRKRSPEFRERILTIYGYRCAICGLKIQIGNIPVALEAAHIKWHQAGGPDIETNGLCLCTLHHKLLDRGAFTLSDDRRILISEKVHGNDGFEQTVGRFHNAPIAPPISEKYYPDRTLISWHRSQVFHLPVRD